MIFLFTWSLILSGDRNPTFRESEGRGGGGGGGEGVEGGRGGDREGGDEWEWAADDQRLGRNPR